MDPLSLSFFGIWYGVGVASFAFWWSNDRALRRREIFAMLWAGLVGPLAFPLGWAIHRPLRTGTASLLFGVHQFAWHPVTVWLAWRRLYGWPGLRETVCIIVHDWGYWGCPEMDGFSGSRHPYLGANIAGRLFGPKYHDLVLYHSRALSKRLGRAPSKLCWADKLSMIYDPSWFYIPRAKLSGEIMEYRREADRRDFIGWGATHEQWHKKLVDHLADKAKRAALGEPME